MGYGLVKAKLLKSEDSKPLSIIGLYIISPAVMIEAFQIDYKPEILQGLMLSLGMAVFLNHHRRLAKTRTKTRRHRTRHRHLFQRRQFNYPDCHVIIR